MKKLLLMIIVAAVGVSAMAKPISKSSAAAKAAKYMSGMSSQSKGMRTPGTGRIQSVLTTDAADEAYYAFNATDGKGFVIISGDDELPELVGYSKSGSLSADDMADGLKFYLKCYTEYVRQLRAGLVQPRKQTSDNRFTPVVDTLITTKWHQAYPFNKYAPAYENNTDESYQSHYAIGCVALAIAQVMNYWKWPKSINPETEKLEGKYDVLDDTGKPIQGQTGIVTAVYPNADGNKPYDWDRIGQDRISYDNKENLDDYDAKADAIGLLLRDVAYGLNMSWGIGGGGTTPQAGVLTKYFGYSMDVSHLFATHFDGGNKGEDWWNLIKTDLDKHQPIIYQGQTAEGAGHCFVFDGYDTGNRVHVNWGWGGRNDGWFDVYYLNSTMFDERAEGNYNFSLKCEMLNNLHPNYEGKEEHMKPDEHKVKHYTTYVTCRADEGEGDMFGDIDKTPFIARINSAVSLMPTSFIDCWMSGISYDVRYSCVSQKTGEVTTYIGNDIVNATGSSIYDFNCLCTGYVDMSGIEKLEDGIYKLTVDYNVFNDIHEQTGWISPLLHKAGYSLSLYMEKKDGQQVFYTSPTKYNVIDYKHVDDENSIGWFNVISNLNLDSLQVGSTVNITSNIDVPAFKKPATEMTEENSTMYISIINEDGTIFYKNGTNLGCKSAGTHPETGETLYSAYASGSYPVAFNSPGIYTLVVDAPLFGYSTRKEFTVGDKQATGITSITSTHSPNSSAVYTLSGQRVTGSYRGIVISNGKKKLVR